MGIQRVMAEQFLSFLLQKQRFFLTTHSRPDGDAIGSQLALGLFLKNMGKDVFMLNSDHIPDNIAWLPGADRIQTYEKSIAQRALADQADVIVVLDANALDRLGDVGALVENSTAAKALIDHHPNPDTWFDASYHRDSASSTAELVYELIAAHDIEAIDTPIASALYAGIVTDTGSFRYSAVVPELHRIVAEIIERGELHPADIHTAIYDTRSLSGLRLLSRALATVTLKYDDQLGYMTISQKLLRDLQADSDETDGFVNYALSIGTVQVALLFLETAKGTKVNFRSKGNVAVNHWAQSLGGGGHRNASGAFIKKSLDATIRTVIEAAPKFISFAPPPDEVREGPHQLSDEDATYLSSLLNMKTDQSS